MTDNFCPRLKAQLNERRKARRRKDRVKIEQLKLKKYLDERGLKNVSDDPNITRMVPPKSV